MIYSPSSRDEFAFCNRKYWLRKQGWVSRTVEYPELCAIGGNAVGKAMELWNKRLIESLPVECTELVQVAIREMRDQLQKNDEAGRIVTDTRAIQMMDELPHLVTAAVQLLWKENPLKRYAILAAEEEYVQYGKSRSDVRVKRPDDRQIIFDYKCKFGEVETRWLPKNLEQYATGEQRFTYTSATNTDLFGIIMVVMKPTVSKRLAAPQICIGGPWPVTEWQKAMWHRDAILMTAPMDRVLLETDPKQVMGRPYPHGNSFGPCVYEKACMEYGLDEEKMRLDYIQIERKQ